MDLANCTAPLRGDVANYRQDKCKGYIVPACEEAADETEASVPCGVSRHGLRIAAAGLSIPPRPGKVGHPCGELGSASVLSLCDCTFRYSLWHAVWANAALRPANCIAPGFTGYSAICRLPLATYSRRISKLSPKYSLFCQLVPISFSVALSPPALRLFENCSITLLHQEAFSSGALLNCVQRER